MRPILWLILCLAFSIGMCCAVALRFLYFEAMPVAVQTAEPQTKILVAKWAIPSGIEITADFLLFQEVAVSEVPLGAITNFAQVYRRQLAYPIPAGCPICEELLLPPSAAATPTAFLPPGSQVVSLDVSHIRRGDRVVPLKEPLSTVLAVQQGVDIRVVRPEAHGRLAEKKNEVLRTFASHDVRNSGDLILENVPIYRMQRQFVADRAGSVRESLELVLDKSEAALLTAASKRGQLRILAHQGPEKTAPPPVEIERLIEVADSSTQTFSASLPFEPFDVPSLSEPLLPVPVESAPIVPVDAIQQVFPVSDMEEIVDGILPPAPVPDVVPLCPETNELLQDPDQPLDSPADSAAADSVAAELVIKEKIRNDAPVLAFGTPALRIISERLAEQDQPMPLLPTHGREESLPTSLAYSETETETVAELPRVSQSLNFYSSGKVAPAKEATKPPGSAELQEIQMLTLAPLLIHERVQGYSPFERRIFTVSANEELSESPGAEPMPPKQLRAPGSETKTP